MSEKAAKTKKSISSAPDNTSCATNKSPTDKYTSDNCCINKVEAQSDCFKQNSSGQPVLNSNCEAEAGDTDLCRVQPRVGLDTGGSLGLSAPADLSSVDSRTCSSVKQSTLESSSGVSSPTHLIYNPQNYKPDQELNSKVRRACERISENVHICANEPSLAFYRLAEHVRKALPPTVESRVQVKRLHQQLLGVYYDAEYGLESVKNIDEASPHLSNIQDLLKNSIFLQQQIKYENARKSKKDTDLSMYQRLSAHLTSVDLPQLDLLDSISRETKSRVETFTFSSNQQSSQGKNTQQTSNVASSTISSNTASNITFTTEKEAKPS